MAYKLIIAEKPSVAKAVAKIVGATSARTDKACGYLEGNGYRVTWAFGHLVGIRRPEDMGFTGNTLPILPDEFKTDVIQPKGDMADVIRKQMKTLDGLFGGAEKIIVATDAGREGELIFRYIYEYLQCRTPFERLWISSLTDEAIRKGLSALLPGSRMEPLSEAAHARSEADWLVGYNASRALRTASAFKGNLSLGRVQTPVLCMVVERFEANRDFVPTPFWQVVAEVAKDGAKVQVASVNKYHSEEDAQAVAKAVSSNGVFLVKNVETKDVRSRPPLLYDLTALQRAANSKYGLTADDTLRAAQSLYEKKHLSYPRTGSRYIPDDVFRTIPNLIALMGKCDRDSFRAAAKDLSGKKLCTRSVDASKVTDHHALLPTEVVPTALSGNEKKVWELVAGRMLEAFGEDSVSKRTTVELECSNIPFRVTGSVPVKAGWKAVFGLAENEEEVKKASAEEGEDDFDGGQLPDFRQGESVRGTDVQTVRKTDKPLPVFTDSSLLGEMETCGRKIEDEELRESMKDVGLGTPATRAATIERLISIGYVCRNGKKLEPTELGTQVAKTVRGRKIAEVTTTGEWERELALIEQGKKSKKAFDTEIRKYTVELIDDIVQNCKSLDGLPSAGSEPARSCPLCGHAMKNLKFAVLCDEGDGGCGCKLPREIAGKKIPASALDALAAGRQTAIIKGFTNKAGKKFDAALKLDAEARKPAFAFPEREHGTAMAGKTCPCCGAAMADAGWKLTCACGFEVYKSYGGKLLDEDKIDRLLSGGKVPLKGMTNKAGKKYDATLTVNAADKKIDFLFDNKKKK